MCPRALINTCSFSIRLGPEHTPESWGIIPQVGPTHHLPEFPSRCPRVLRSVAQSADPARVYRVRNSKPPSNGPSGQALGPSPFDSFANVFLGPTTSRLVSLACFDAS